MYIAALEAVSIYRNEIFMGINVKLQAFEGPLDLLLHLIDKNKVNIYDIPIAMITEQYMEYVNQMDKEDLNIVSEFLVMAATLLDIKSRMLLPKEINEDGDEEDPRAELVEKLLEYKLFKYMSYELKDKQIDAEKAFFKQPTVPKEVEAYKPPVDLEALVGDMTLAKLNMIFQDVMKRKEDKVDPIRSKFGKIEKEEVSMSEKLVYVKSFLKRNKSFSFRHMLLENSSKVATIVTFLVVLELIKTGFVTVEQDGADSDIAITVVKDPELISDMMDE
jgi:segregation and condensation protein A